MECSHKGRLFFALSSKKMKKSAQTMVFMSKKPYLCGEFTS